MNKKSVNILMENTVFILLILVFVFAIGLSITRIGSNTALYEQIYAKEIVLLLNKAEPGMKVEMDLTRAFNLATKNKFQGQIVRIENNENKINVRLVNGEGYDYYFFNDLDVSWNLDKEKRKLFLTFYEKV